MNRKLNRLFLLISIITFSAYIGCMFIIGITASSSNSSIKKTDNIVNSQDNSGMDFKDIQQDACCGHKDTEAPSIQLSSPANNSFNSGGITIRISIMDNNPFDENKATEVLYRWNIDQSNTSLDESDEDFIYKVELPSDLGTYALFVYAGDRSGNWGSAVFGFSVTSSITNPPTINFIAPSSSNESLSGLYVFHVNVIDDLGLLEVKMQIDSRASKAMDYNETSGYYYKVENVSKLPTGHHWLHVTAIDLDADQHTVTESIDFTVIDGEEGTGIGDPPEWILSKSDLPVNISDVDISDYEAESDNIYFMVAVKDDNGISAVDFTVYILDEYDPSTGEPDITDARKDLSQSLSRIRYDEDWEIFEFTWDSTSSIDSYYLCEFEIQDTDEVAHHLYIRVVIEVDNVRDQPSSVDIGGAPGFEIEMLILALISWILITTLIKRRHGKE